MKTDRIVPLIYKIMLAMFLLLTGHPAIAADDVAGWLMVVKSNSTDIAREDEFNHWYDEIDIPDVLEVPGYLRARRGKVQRLPALAASKDDAGYLALYNIQTNDMDGTIIDMLLASWNMEKLERSTGLIQVTERLYYRQYSPSQKGAVSNKGVVPDQENEYIFMVRAKCCTDTASRADFDDWYDNRYLPALVKADGFLRATRYELHRVVMINPVDMPVFLGVYEVSASSADQALKNIMSAVRQVGGHRFDAIEFTEIGSNLYLKIKDAVNE